MKVIVIGGGPSGMMAAIQAAKNGNDVILLEKKESLGKKLLITGKGRCNITSSLDIKEFISNIPGNGMFMYGAFNKFNNLDIINLLKQEGLEVKEERGHRIFPVTDNAGDVLNVFLKLLNTHRVRIITNAKVTRILEHENKVTGVKCSIDNKEILIKTEKIILATGGKSYPGTGSTGDGYILAEELGHSVTDIMPSLVPLVASSKSVKICKELQGLSLRNVAIKIEDKTKNKKIYEDFGEMIFTHFGVSGPTILSGSAHLQHYIKLNKSFVRNRIALHIDLKPALSEEKLEERILRDFSRQKNKEFKNSLNELLPSKMIELFIKLTKIDREKKVNSVTREERRRMVQLLKNFEIEIEGFRPIDEAIVTSGGISIKEINPKTMESKIIEGLYFAGEIIDVDAYTGGFNLQIAYSTGYVAGNN